MNKKRTIVAAAVIALVLLVGGILAYFTDTDEKTNVFTIGNVHIQLNEASWTEITEDDGEGGTTGTGEYSLAAAQNITPNKVIPKAPKVKNIGNDETGNGNGNDAYVFLKVVIPNEAVTVGGAQSARAQDLFTPVFNDADGINPVWTEITSTMSPAPAAGTHIYVYGTGTAKTAMTRLTYNQETPQLFDSVRFADLDDPSELSALTQRIVITAYGIQADDVSETTAATIFANF